MYIIGIDGGGTKTKFTLFDTRGNVVDSVILPSCHVLQKPDNEVVNILKVGIDKLTSLISSEESIIISAGLAGYGKNHKIKNHIEYLCEIAFSPYPYYLFNDAEIALEGALAGEEGILLIAGTGSIAISKFKNKYQRCGGWGYLFGDEGSAYWIALELFKHYTYQVDGREPRTQLVTLLKEHCKFTDDYDLIYYVTNILEKDRTKIAAHAILLGELIEVKDPVGDLILEKLAKQLARLINSLTINFENKVKVSYVGGVFLLGEKLFVAISKYLVKPVIFIKPINSPEMGAFLLIKK